MVVCCFVGTNTCIVDCNRSLGYWVLKLTWACKLTMNNIEAIIYCLSTLKSQDRDGESDRVFDGNGNKHWISIANGKVKLNNNCGYSEFRQDKYTTEVVPRLRFRILEAIGSNDVTFSEMQRVFGRIDNRLLKNLSNFLIVLRRWAAAAYRLGCLMEEFVTELIHKLRNKETK